MSVLYVESLFECSNVLMYAISKEPDTAESPEESPPVVTRGTLQGRSADETTYARRQPDTMTPKEAAAEMPPSTDYCLRCSKDLRNLKDFKCTRPTQYSKCRECARKRKPCESVPDHFHGRFEKVHRLFRDVYLSDIPMPEYEKARASYKTDVEAYLKKTVAPSKSSTRGAIMPSQSETNSLLRALVSEVRGLRNDFRVIVSV